MSETTATRAFDRRSGLEQWFHSPLGQAVLASEQSLLADKLPYLFGYHLLRLGAVGAADITATSKIGFRFSLAPDGGGGEIPAALAEFDALPLESDSIDVVLLHHLLEFCERPHAILREASRVLVPNGRLLIVAFNPWSMLGLRQAVARWSNPVVWRCRHIGAARLMDWLSLLGLRVVDVRFGFYRLPVDSPRWLRRRVKTPPSHSLVSLPVGGIYLIDACKTVAALTPLRPRWKRVGSGVQLPVAHPGTPTRPCTNRSAIRRID